MKKVSFVLFIFILALFSSCKGDVIIDKGGGNGGVTLSADSDTEFDYGSRIVFPELTQQLVANLDLLGKVWGLLKYHHPYVQHGLRNWDYELFRILPQYLTVENNQERDQTLLNWINKYGGITICTTCRESPFDAYIKPNLLWAEESDMSDALIEKIKEVYNNRYQVNHYYIRINPSVGNPQFIRENPYSNMPYPDAGFRLLALFRYWNMVHYFFPSTYLTDKNWEDVLEEYIPIFLSATNKLEYELATIQVIGEINDTHASGLGGGTAIAELKGSRYAPIRVWFIEGKLVVTDYYDWRLKEAVGIEIGDVITHINGESVDFIVDSLRKYYPASNEASRLRNISFDLLRSNNSTISVDYYSSGSSGRRDIQMYTRYQLNDWYGTYKVNPNEKCYKFLEWGIGYITMATIQDGDVPVIRELFEQTKGIIIDIRNYPSAHVPYTLGSFFVSNVVPFVKFTVGNAHHPGEFSFSTPYTIPGTGNTFHGKLIVIVNEVSQSNAEFQAMAFRAGMNTIVIGSTTAGADGNVSEIWLPGGLRTVISGIGVYYPDGRQTQRIGIVPDIWIEPTIEGIREGRDELLEMAIKIINEDSG
ncbi:MAG: S41 family peptidase [Bacteroidales bacterium]|nr:S41 family peptidase [Bacteroidales bacterium]